MSRKKREQQTLGDSKLKIPTDTSDMQAPKFRPLNKGQAEALAAISNPDNSVVFLDGVAGSGKTYLAASWALTQLMAGNVNKIILTRPVVEAGEKLGALPGSYEEKIGPYMNPIYDVLLEHVSLEQLKKLKEEGKVDVRPLAYMRGTTFKNAVVLLDEAQNCNCKQMQMFLTRLGENAKLIIAGDKAQSDLRYEDGFFDALERLKDIAGIAIVELDEESIVRHPLVKEIVRAYSKVLED